MKNTAERITHYVKAGYAGLYLVSHEELRVESELLKVAQGIGFDLYVWTITGSLMGPFGKEGEQPRRWPADPNEIYGPVALLQSLNTVLPRKSIVLAKDFHLFTGEEDAGMIRHMRECLAVARAENRTLVVLGCEYRMRPELQKEFTLLEFDLPDREALQGILEGIARSARITLNGNTDKILDAASGLTTTEAADAFALAVVESGGTEISATIVGREKSNTVKKSGLLEIIEVTDSIDSMGGCANAKSWILKRRHAFGKEAIAYGLPIPKGILLVGVSGAGKTHLSKIISSVLNVPLLKLDGGKLFSSLVGSSEANVRSVISTAEAASPCVLLVDEIEKAFSGTQSSGATDGGTTSRVFGTFLQWLNDKTKPVFVVATSNTVSQLPPEFLRKGRFDELFFVDLPDHSERRDIFRIHLAKRKRDASAFNLDALAAATDGFTGAEIEAVVTESLFSAFDEGVEVQDQHLLEAVKSTIPLSRTMAASVQALRDWAKGRTRHASAVAESIPITPGSRQFAV